MSARQELHHLLDELPDESLLALQGFMTALSATTPSRQFEFRDDEGPFTAEQAAIMAAGQATAGGEGQASQDELLARTRSAGARR